MKSPISMLRRLAAEPPFRLFVKHALALLPCSVETRARWDLSARPHYLVGTLFAAQRARVQGIREISVIEFGVAAGNGLLALQAEAEAVERATGVAIRVYGFDAGPGGLPTFCGDYRDHPDMWMPGDYPMDVDALRPKLAPRTTLILGDIRENIERFREEYDPSPIGFLSIDVDLYSSTAAALRRWTSARSSATSRSTATTSTSCNATGGPASCSPSRSSTRSTPTSRSTDGRACGTIAPFPSGPGSTECSSATTSCRSRSAS